LDGVGLGPAGDSNPFWLAPIKNVQKALILLETLDRFLAGLLNVDAVEIVNCNER
jgi:hypothetical protein